MIGGIDPEHPRHFPNPFNALMLTLAAIFTMVLVVVAFGPEGMHPGALGVGQALGFGLIGTLGARLVPEPQTERIGMRGFSPQLIPALLLLLPAVFVLSEVDNWITDFLPTPGSPELDELMAKERASRTPISIAQGAILLVGIAPVVEEWLYRGVIQQGLVAYLGRPGGLLFTSLLFSLGSASSMASTNWLSMLVTTSLLGLLLGFARLATGSLLAAMLLHAAFNAMSLAARLSADTFPIQGFNGPPGAHSSLSLLLPSLLFVGVGISLLRRELVKQPDTLPLPPPRRRDDD